MFGADFSRSVYSSVFGFKERPHGKQPPPHKPAGRFPIGGFRATNYTLPGFKQNSDSLLLFLNIYKIFESSLTYSAKCYIPLKPPTSV